jgi:HK97 family phage prohead protease
MQQFERRAVSVSLQGQKLSGHAIVFDVQSRDLGGFVEVVRPQAIQRALQSDANVVALYNHDPGQVLGRTPSTLQLRQDDRGLAFVIDPPDTASGRDALALVRRGDIDGASFGFRTIKDAWRTEGNQMVRELLDIDIREISLTAFPAYPSTNVEIAQRSLQAYQSSRQTRLRTLQRRHRVRLVS